MKKFINTLIKNRKPLLVALGFCAVILLWLGGSLINLVHNKLEKTKLIQRSIFLDKEQAELLRTKQLLQEQDAALLEKIARTEYDLAKPGEMEFRFKTK